MRDYSNIKYERIFLNQVIFRIDFLQFFETETLFNEAVEGTILKLFSRRGMDQRVNFGTINVLIDTNKPYVSNTQPKTVGGLQREYYAGKNKLVLSNKFLVYEINEYDTFEKHYSIFQTVFNALNTKQSITSARVGIRYINIFGADDLKLRKNMFSPEISATFNAKEYISDYDVHLIRAINMHEYQADNMLLNFRYGMFNPDYPNPLNKESFALDYDSFTTEPAENTDTILTFIKKGHAAIQELFEKSITDNLRKVLNNE